MNREIDALLKMADKSIRGARLLFEDGLYGYAVLEGREIVDAVDLAFISRHFKK